MRNEAAAPESMAKATAAVTDAATGSQRMVDLTGRVTYRTRQALPPGAMVGVRLLDVSRVDVPAQELGRIVIVTKGEQVPVPFAIRYDANAIDARRRYSVQATITIAGRVAFRTTTAHLVLTNGGSGTNVEVVVEPQR
jgi:putative lipoprotein